MNVYRAFNILNGYCEDCGRHIGSIQGTGNIVGYNKSDTIKKVRGFLVICDYYNSTLCPDCAVDRFHHDFDSEREFYKEATICGITGMYDDEIEDLGLKVSKSISETYTENKSRSDWRSSIADFSSSVIGSIMISDPVLGSIFGLLMSLVVKSTKWD